MISTRNKKSFLGPTDRIGEEARAGEMRAGGFRLALQLCSSVCNVFVIVIQATQLDSISIELEKTLAQLLAEKSDPLGRRENIEALTYEILLLQSKLKTSGSPQI